MRSVGQTQRFERTKIGSGVLGVRESVVRPVVRRVLNGRLKDGVFRELCRSHQDHAMAVGASVLSGLDSR